MLLQTSNDFDRCLRNFGRVAMVTRVSSPHFGKCGIVVGCNSLKSELSFRFEYVSLELADGTKTIERPKHLTF